MNPGIDLLLGRVDDANRQSLLAIWRVAAAAGMWITIVDDGELAMSASPDVPGRSRNRVVGLAARPDLLPRAVAFFAREAIEGWAEMDPGDATRAGLDPAIVAAADRSAFFAAEVEAVQAGPGVQGVIVREVFEDQAARWVEASIAANSNGPDRDRWLRRMAPHLLGSPGQAGRRLYAAEAGGQFVGVGALFTFGGVGWLTAAAVRPDFRRRGIQGALIGARAAAAAAGGCTHVASDALVGEGSDRNLARAGLVHVATRVVVPLPRPGELRPPG